jgi:cation-transporting ATPase 13A1
MTGLSKSLEDRGEIDLEKKFEPTLLNTAIYLLGLSQQVSTFVLNFQGRPFREGIRENPPLYYGLLGASLVAYSGASEFIPELNSWLQLVKMSGDVSFPLLQAYSRAWLINSVQGQIDSIDVTRFRTLLCR